MSKSLKKYLSKIGQKGGKKSRRLLDPETARKMVAAREAKKLSKTGDTMTTYQCNECGQNVPPNTNPDIATNDAGEETAVYLCPSCSVNVDHAAGVEYPGHCAVSGGE